VPEAIIAFLEAKNYEQAVRNGISLGGDSDTIGCIAGGIAQAFYKAIPEAIIANVKYRLPEEFWEIIEEFNEKYGIQI
jgi:ADP-ribosylglycohydrolase